MLEGMRAAASGMIAQQRHMDALSNDIANVNTSGYKHERTSFRDLVASATGLGGAKAVTAGAGATAESAGRGALVRSCTGRGVSSVGAGRSATGA